ncbi:MAG: hypothetical protein COB98_00865 [Flavobacteriaceae bacterium]|nr:MAG: hypothetical protein COB98_00865 [Flavobacteriaceae bacterium]
MKFKLTCDEATAICSKNQYGEASVTDKFRMLFHVLFCAVCKLYSKQNTFMTKCMSSVDKKGVVKSKLNSEEKEEMALKIKEMV